MLDPISVASYSKAPRGLSVLLRVTCIFTGTSVSPSTWPRRRPAGYAIRAGRNFMSSLHSWRHCLSLQSLDQALPAYWLPQGLHHLGDAVTTFGTLPQSIQGQSNHIGRLPSVSPSHSRTLSF